VLDRTNNRPATIAQGRLAFCPPTARLILQAYAPKVKIITAAAIRKRREREHSEDVKVLDVRMHYYNLVEALLVSERLAEAEALDRAKVEAEASEILTEWVRRWLNR
jgi:hypothetical protein